MIAYLSKKGQKNRICLHLDIESITPRNTNKIGVKQLQAIGFTVLKSSNLQFPATWGMIKTEKIHYVRIANINL